MKRRWTIPARRFLVLAAVAAPLLLGTAPALAASASPAAAAAGNPAVTGPVSGGNGAIVLQGTSFDLGRAGYTQSEFFVSGTASSYTPAAPLGSGGRWHVTQASTAPYTTRMVVYRPADPARFNGTVIVEWLNVSAGLDVAADWIYDHNELIRDGFAWVGVSAQAAGVAADKAADPVRYAALSHPGDSYSYDIFAQAGRPCGTQAAKVLGGLRPRRVLAEGESQSAFRLTTYIDAIQPLTHVYDGFLVHSRGGGSAPLSQAPQADVPAPPVVYFPPGPGRAGTRRGDGNRPDGARLPARPAGRLPGLPALGGGRHRARRRLHLQPRRRRRRQRSGGAGGVRVHAQPPPAPPASPAARRSTPARGTTSSTRPCTP